MRNPRFMFNTASALHRVFIAPIERSNLTHSRYYSPHSLSRTTTAPKQLLSNQQTRSYGHAKRQITRERRLPRDEEIRSSYILLVNEEGRLEQQRSTNEVLCSFDSRTHSLVTVAEGGPQQLPVCKIMEKKAMRDAEKVKAKAARDSVVTTKTIELNWAIDIYDLGHRLQRIREFLGKGHRVEVIMAPKRKGKKATEAEAQSLVDRVRSVVGQCEGSRESKPMEGKLLGTAMIYLEGKRQEVKDNPEEAKAEP